MAIIQVYRSGVDRPLGTGNGTIDAKAKTATIASWTDKGAVLVGTQYTLKSGGKTYSAQCATNTIPVTFNNVQ